MKYLEITFKLSCILAVSLMIGYWIYKFNRNDDITLIEYKSVNELDDVILPELSLCIREPFLSRSFSNKTGSLKEEKGAYENYLRGNINLRKEHHDVEYDNVTLNVFDYFKSISIEWKSRANKIFGDCTNINDCPYFTFTNKYNGFVSKSFLMCFGVAVNKKFSKDVGTYLLVLNSKLRDIIGDTAGVLASFSLPNQFLRNVGAHHPIRWSNNDKFGTDLLEITTVEMLKRRNKRNEPCVAEWIHYDKLVERHHVEIVGCRAPYQTLFTDFPICNTTEKMKEAHFDGFKLMHEHHHPCQELPNIDLHYGLITSRRIWGDNITIYVSYPDKWKIITQSQAVDIHALIGNIGGYIGLFLGKLLYCWSYLKIEMSVKRTLIQSFVNNFAIFVGYAIIQVPQLLRYLHSLLSKTDKIKTLSQCIDTNEIGPTDQNQVPKSPTQAKRINGPDKNRNNSLTIVRGKHQRNIGSACALCPKESSRIIERLEKIEDTLRIVLERID